MNRGWAAAALLGAALAACAPAARAQVDAPRLPKGTPGTPDGSTQIQLTRLAAPTPTPTRTPPPTSIYRLDWPEPNTFGPLTPSSTPIPGPVRPYVFSDKVVNILLIGSDRRPAASSYRTDVLILLSIHPESNGAALLSIPRDLYVYIPGFSMNRVNAAFGLGESYRYPGGGPGLLADTILYNLGIPVHHYARVEMDGFRSTIDTLGGIQVHVACPYTDWRLKSPNLDPEEEDSWALFTTPAGIVSMDGEYALWYARARLKSSDFDRSRRQQEVLRAIYRRMLRLDLIPQLPSLYGQLNQTIITNMSLGDLLQLAPLATRIDLSQVRSRFIGREAVTSWRTPSGAQVLIPKPDAVQAVLDEAFAFELPDPLLPSTFSTVELINASNRTDWDILASERLTYAGFATHVGPPAPSPGTPTHVIDYSLASEVERDAILKALGLSSAALVEQPNTSSPFAFRVVIGDNYKPCFNPAGSTGPNP